MGRALVTPKDPKAIFLPYQGRWIADKSRLKLYEKSRQIGLSWSTAYATVSRTALQTARNDEWVSSRDDTQAKLFLEDCKLWAGNLKLAASDMGEVVLDEAQKHTAYALRFANGKRINSMSSNPDAQAGKRGGRILDEFALHPDPRKLWTIAYPGITWGGSMEVISTHRGSQNFFNQLVREARESGNPKKISLHRTTLEDALNEGFLFKLQKALPADDERQEMTEADYFNWVKSGAADDESFQQEYMCHPADDNTAFLEYDLIAGVEYSSSTDWKSVGSGQLYAGVDIGRKKDLTVLWVIEKLGDVFYTRHVEAMQNMRKSEQEKIIWPIVESEDTKALAEVLDKLVPLGLEVSMNHVRERIGFEDPDEGDEVLRSKGTSGGDELPANRKKPALPDPKKARASIEACPHCGGRHALAADQRSGGGDDVAIDELVDEALADWEADMDPAIKPIEELFATAKSFDDLMLGFDNMSGLLDMNPVARRLAISMLKAKALGITGGK